jgi:hypothetical protein
MSVITAELRPVQPLSSQSESRHQFEDLRRE